MCIYLCLCCVGICECVKCMCAYVVHVNMSEYCVECVFGGYAVYSLVRVHTGSAR